MRRQPLMLILVLAGVLLTYALWPSGGTSGSSGPAPQAPEPTLETPRLDALSLPVGHISAGGGGGSGRIRGASIDVGPFELRLQAGDDAAGEDTGGVVAGVVSDQDGEGVRGIRVQARDGVPQGRRVSRRAHRRGAGRVTTGADGGFRFEGLRPGSVELEIRAPREFLEVADLTVQTGETDVRIELKRGGFLSGRVLEADGSPAAEVPLEARPRDHPVGPWVRGTTAADGTFRLVGLDPSIEYRVRMNFSWRNAGRADFLRIYSAWVRPGTSDIELRLVKGLFIKGRVLTSAGTPASSGSVVAFPQDPEARAEGGTMFHLKDADGSFTLGPLAPGRYKVTANTRDALQGHSQPVILEAPADEVELRYSSRLTRPGIVLGEDVEHFRIVWWARQADGSLAMGRGGSGKDGRFTIGQMTDVAGTVFVYRREDGRCAWIENVRPSDKPLEVRLVEGLTITGRVELSSSGTKKWDGMTMVLAHPVGVHSFNQRSQLDAEGNFRIRGLPEGTYVVRCHGTGKRGPALEVEAGATSVVLQER